MMIKPALRWLMAAILLGGGIDASARAGEIVDLELVLAVDASSSVDDREFALQLGGIAAAFHDGEVRAAIAGGPSGRIAVNLMIWAGHQLPKDATGWRIIASGADADEFAALVERLPRSQTGATGIGEAIAAALRSIASNDIEGRRKVIDVSGDGRETAARSFTVQLPQARAMAYAGNVTINGLAIANGDAGLLSYYRNAVAAGAESFVIEASDYADIASAMRRKLLREIEHRPKLTRR